MDKTNIICICPFRHIDSGLDISIIDWEDNFTCKYTLSNNEVLILSNNTVGMFYFKDDLGNIYIDKDDSPGKYFVQVNI